MIKKIKLEIATIAILILGIFIFSNFDINLYKILLNFNNSSNNTYFKEFFINITEIGNSIWFFLIAFFLYLICLFFKKKLNEADIYYIIKNSALFLFTSILIAGALTQLIKHIIGRPRPNHAIDQNNFGIDLFNFESSFHSFPSGHASTIFAVALVMSLLTPKIKYFYMFYAFLIAFSRIVVGAHFFTDIIGGIAVAFIGFKITLYLFEKYNKKKFYPIIEINSNIFFLSLIVFFIAIIFITIGGSIDIFISSLFYTDQKIFFLQDFDTITILTRKIFLPFLILYILIFPIVSLHLPLKKIYLNFNFNIKSILFLWLSMLFNLIIVVNLLLKNIWGRARPNEILQLGGKDSFTPWFRMSDECLTNCSFVSGDASVGFSLIALFFLTKNIFFFWGAILSGLGLGIIRVLEGGHFISDVLVAGFLIFLLVFLQYHFFKKL